MKVLHRESSGDDLGNYISKSSGSINVDFLTEPRLRLGILKTALFDDCRVSRLTIAGHKMNSKPRSSQEIREKERCVKLFFQVSGTQEIHTEQGECLINAGDWALFDPNIEYSGGVINFVFGHNM